MLKITIHTHFVASISDVCQLEHVNSIPTIQFFTGIAQRKILYAIINYRCLGIPKIRHRGILVNVPYIVSHVGSAVAPAALNVI